MGDIAFLVLFAVDVQIAALDFNGIARQADDALDEIFRAVGVMANDDIKALRVARLVFKARSEHNFIVLQRFDHGMAVHTHKLEQECADDERQRDGHRKGQNPGKKLLLPRFFLRRLFSRFFG